MLIENYKESENDLVNYIGGKGYGLRKLYDFGQKIPKTYVIENKVAYEFIEQNNIRINIEKILLSDDNEKEKAGKIKSVIIDEKNKDDALEVEILKALKELGLDKDLAIRSSALSEDSKQEAWAGQLDSYLNIRPEIKLIKKQVKLCWASLFSRKALYYRKLKGIKPIVSPMAVLIQHMVSADYAGVCFTINPVSKDINNIVVECVLGLGEPLVSGVVSPYRYQIAKNTLEIMRSYSPNDIDPHPLIDADRILHIARISKDLETQYGFSLDIEWAVSNGNIFLLQSRPITT